MNNENKIVESNNYMITPDGFFSQGNGNDQRSIPTQSGKLSVVTNLYYLTKQFAEINRNDKTLKQPDAKGNRYVHLGGITIFPDQGQSSPARKRLAFYGFNMDMLPNVTHISVTATVNRVFTNQLILAYKKVYDVATKNKLNFSELLRKTPVITTGNYRNTEIEATGEFDGLNKIQVAQQATVGNIFLRYVSLQVADGINSFTPQVKPFISTPLTATDPGVNINKTYLGTGSMPEQEDYVRIQRCSNNGGRDATVTGFATVGYLKNFNSHKQGVVNLSKHVGINPRTGEESPFYAMQVGSFDWTALSQRDKILFPDNIIQLFNQFKVQYVNLTYNVPGKDFRNGSVENAVMQYDFQPEHDSVIAYAGALPLNANVSDFNPETLENVAPSGNKQIRLYRNKNGVVNAEIRLKSSATFVYASAQGNIPPQLTEANSENSGENTNGTGQNSVQLAPADLSI